MNSVSLIGAIVRIKTTGHRKVGEFILRRPMTEWETIALTGNCKLLSALGLQRKKRQGRIRTMWTGVGSGYLYYVNQGKKEPTYNEGWPDLIRSHPPRSARTSDKKRSRKLNRPLDIFPLISSETIK